MNDGNASIIKGEARKASPLSAAPYDVDLFVQMVIIVSTGRLPVSSKLLSSGWDVPV